jgi:hypothetical protein
MGQSFFFTFFCCRKSKGSLILLLANKPHYDLWLCLHKSGPQLLFTFLAAFPSHFANRKQEGHDGPEVAHLYIGPPPPPNVAGTI